MTTLNRIVWDIYRRGGRYYATVEMNGPDEKFVDLPDAFPLEPTVESIAASLRHLEPLIREALAAAPKGASYEWWNDRRWERMGATSRRQFIRSTSFCSVERYPDYIKIWYVLYDKDVNDFASIGEEPNARLPPDSSYEDIARAVLDIFTKYPPPPGDKTPAPKRPRKSAATKP